MTSRRVGVAAAVAVVVIATTGVAGALATRGDHDRGLASQRLDNNKQIIGDTTLIAGERMITRTADEVVWRDVADLDVIASVDRHRARVDVADDGRFVALSGGGVVELFDDAGERLWERRDGSPRAITADGIVTTSYCANSACDVTGIDAAGDVLWEHRLDASAAPVGFGEGAMLTYPGDSAVVALPVAVVVTVADGEGRDVVRLDPVAGEMIELASGTGRFEVDVVPSAIAVLADADSDRCQLSLFGHDGELRERLAGDCTDPGDGSNDAYLFAEDDGFVWVGATEIRFVAADGTEGEPIAVGTPRATPTRGGIVRSGTRDGWSLERADGTEVLAAGWNWLHDITGSAVAVGRQLEVGPFWSRSTVYEVAVIDIADGSVCGSQRLPADTHPLVFVLPGCRAIATAVADRSATWLIGE